MKIAPNDRAKVKAECLRLLVTLKLDPAKTRLIAKFVDTYLRLDSSEEQMFQAEVDKMGIVQKENIMQGTTSWEERGMEKERNAIALNSLRENIPLDTISRITGLPIAQLQQLQAQLQAQANQ